jgi:hypothetical protein
MIGNEESYSTLRREIGDRMYEDRAILDQLRQEIRPLRERTHLIQPRTATSVSLVGTDGGNNTLQFDPFLLQIVRVVDSSNNEYCLEVVSPTSNVERLSRKHLDEGTALGRMMRFLGVRTLSDLSPMIPRASSDRPVSPSWVQVYRELIEWAVLFSVLREKDFGTDTLIVFDGLLRSKVFAGTLFAEYLDGLQEGIAAKRRQGRRLYLVGVSKHSKVLDRYRLAMALEGILATSYPAYADIPRDIEEKAYVWSEYARGNDNAELGGEVNKFVGGKMFFVKFGDRPRDPIWPIDIFQPQVDQAQAILGYLLADAINGFPVPLYPQCLQKAHENAALVDFDFDVLQDQIFEALRRALDGEEQVLDVFRMQDADPARARYG